MPLTTEELITKAKKIRLVIFDVDGVLTSGQLSYGPKGIQIKEFHVHDGYGMKLLKQTGIELAFMTACKSIAITKRAADLGIKHVYQGTMDKLPSYESLKKQLKLQDDEIAYLADDLPDLPVLIRAGLSITVANAPEVVRDHVNWVTKKKGGKGAAREVCDFILKAQGSYQGILEHYLKR